MTTRRLLADCLTYLAGGIKGGKYGSGGDLDIKAIRDDWEECKEDFERHPAKPEDAQAQEEKE
jgi:hypothetical protein